MIIHSNLSKMKNKILPICLEGNYRGSLGEFSNTLHGVLGADRVKETPNVHAWQAFVIYFGPFGCCKQLQEPINRSLYLH